MTGALTYGSVCSGIEAASVAWEPLGFSPAWFSEIDKFPSSVLAHHWPHVMNVGNMTDIRSWVSMGIVDAPDILVGGTPCQAFSVAGKRESLEDPRGNLSLTYVLIANAIDQERMDLGRHPCITVWENVPGVLTTKDNAFGCFLAGLAGESDPLQPPGGKWTHAGCVYGTQRTVAWRVLDAQYFGLAQRRKRVFVVSSAREGFDPTEILLEWEGLRRDSPARREAEKEIAGTFKAGAGSSGGWSNSIDHAAAGYMKPVPTWWDGSPVSQTLDAVLHKGQTMPEKNRFPAVLQPTRIGIDTPTIEMRVRRLTPTECERLQGFPDGHSLVPYRGKLAADAPRYKALGNSMAVPVMRWVGQRIARQVARLDFADLL